MKKCKVDNDNTADTELEWGLKKYRVDYQNTGDTKIADIAPVLQLEIQVVAVMSQLLFRSICLAVGIMLEMEIRSACQVVVNDNNYNYDNDIVHQKQNECQIILFRLAHQIVRSNDFHFDYGNNFGVLF